MQRQRLLYGAVTVFLLLASVVGLTLAQEADTAPATQRAVPVGMGFTYQGRLDHDGEPVDGECAMAFRLYDAADGIQVGEALTKTVTLSGGLFTQQLDFGDNVTNNQAEYRTMLEGLAEALRVIERSGADPRETSIEIVTDSKLVVEQVNGRWKVKHDGLKPLHARARQLLDQFGQVDLKWQPRARTVKILGH